MTSPELNAHRIFDVLDRHQVDYVVLGGYAAQQKDLLVLPELRALAAAARAPDAPHLGLRVAPRPTHRPNFDGPTVDRTIDFGYS